MESQRTFLLIGFLLVSFLLWQAWQQDQYAAQNPAPVEQASANAQLAGADDIPTAAAGQPVNGGANTDVPELVAQAQTALIEVVTDTLRLKIDPNGGDIVYAELMKYPIEQDKPGNIVLLDNSQQLFYVAQSGVTGIAQGSPRLQYSATANQFVMPADSETFTVTLRAADQGVKVEKRFVFHRDSHAIEVEHLINNGSEQPVSTFLWGRLRQSTTGHDSGSMMMPTFRGGAYSTQDIRYEKLSFEKLVDGKLNTSTQGGWIAMLQHYFVSAWVPSADQTNVLESRGANGNADILFKGPIHTINAGQTDTLSATLVIGPKDQAALSAISESLNLVVDYGFLWWLAQPLHAMLVFFQSLVINWGLAIILITLVVRGAMYPLTKKQYTSMAKMRVLAPKIKELQERYKDNREKMSKAMMELYQKEKVNPLGGCLPIVLQMPIFIALYWVLLESVELRHAGFALWITDLSTKDPYYILPILMGASMFLMQKMSPTTISDPTQQKIMQWMPVIFTAFFLMFPSGLVLYWLVSNLISITQQWYINKSIEKAGLK